MTTTYRLTDTAAKDAGGARILMPVDDQTSQLDFGLLRGIGVEILGATSRNLVHLAVGSHTVGSAIDKGAGILLLGAYTESPSGIGTGGGQALRSDNQGALYTRPASGIMSLNSGSIQTHIATSALLHDIHIRFDDVDVGDDVTIEDGDDYKLTFIATAASQHFSEHYSTGLHFGTNIKSTITIPGAGGASVTVVYSAY